MSFANGPRSTSRGENSLEFGGGVVPDDSYSDEEVEGSESSSTGSPITPPHSGKSEQSTTASVEGPKKERPRIDSIGSLGDLEDFRSIIALSSPIEVAASSTPSDKGALAKRIQDKPQPPLPPQILPRSSSNSNSVHAPLTPPRRARKASLSSAVEEHSSSAASEGRVLKNSTSTSTFGLGISSSSSSSAPATSRTSRTSTTSTHQKSGSEMSASSSSSSSWPRSSFSLDPTLPESSSSRHSTHTSRTSHDVLDTSSDHLLSTIKERTESPIVSTPGTSKTARPTPSPTFGSLRPRKTSLASAVDDLLPPLELQSASFKAHKRSASNSSTKSREPAVISGLRRGSEGAVQVQRLVAEPYTAPLPSAPFPSSSSAPLLQANLARAGGLGSEPNTPNLAYAAALEKAVGKQRKGRPAALALNFSAFSAGKGGLLSPGMVGLASPGKPRPPPSAPPREPLPPIPNTPSFPKSPNMRKGSWSEEAQGEKTPTKAPQKKASSRELSNGARVERKGSVGVGEGEGKGEGSVDSTTPKVAVATAQTVTRASAQPVRVGSVRKQQEATATPASTAHVAQNVASPATKVVSQPPAAAAAATFTAHVDSQNLDSQVPPAAPKATQADQSGPSSAAASSARAAEQTVSPTKPASQPQATRMAQDGSPPTTAAQAISQEGQAAVPTGTEAKNGASNGATAHTTASKTVPDAPSQITTSSTSTSIAAQLDRSALPSPPLPSPLASGGQIVTFDVEPTPARRDSLIEPSSSTSFSSTTKPRSTPNRPPPSAWNARFRDPAASEGHERAESVASHHSISSSFSHLSDRRAEVLLDKQSPLVHSEQELLKRTEGRFAGAFSEIALAFRHLQSDKLLLEQIVRQKTPLSASSGDLNESLSSYLSELNSKVEQQNLEIRKLLGLLEQQKEVIDQLVATHQLEKETYEVELDRLCAAFEENEVVLEGERVEGRRLRVELERAHAEVTRANAEAMKQRNALTEERGRRERLGVELKEVKGRLREVEKENLKSPDQQEDEVGRLRRMLQERDAEIAALKLGQADALIQTPPHEAPTAAAQQGSGQKGGSEEVELLRTQISEQREREKQIKQAYVYIRDELRKRQTNTPSSATFAPRPLTTTKERDLGAEGEGRKLKRLSLPIVARASGLVSPASTGAGVGPSAFRFAEADRKGATEGRERRRHSRHLS